MTTCRHATRYRTKLPAVSGKPRDKQSNVGQDRASNSSVWDGDASASVPSVRGSLLRSRIRPAHRDDRSSVADAARHRAAAVQVAGVGMGSEVRRFPHAQPAGTSVVFPENFRRRQGQYSATSCCNQHAYFRNLARYYRGAHITTPRFSSLDLQPLVSPPNCS